MTVYINMLNMFIILILFTAVYVCTLAFTISEASTTNSQLIQLNDCVCPGEDLLYECTVCGAREGATVWTGSTLSCTSDEIILRHSQYDNDSLTIGSCNNGAVTAQSSKVTNVHSGQCYSSQLNISKDAVESNKTIECIYVVGINETLINTSAIKFTTGK